MRTATKTNEYEPAGIVFSEEQAQKYMRLMDFLEKNEDLDEAFEDWK